MLSNEVFRILIDIWSRFIFPKKVTNLIGLRMRKRAFSRRAKSPRTLADALINLTGWGLKE